MSSKMMSHHPRSRTAIAIDGDGRRWQGDAAFTNADRAVLRKYIDENPRTWTVKGARNALETRHSLSSVQFYLMTLVPADEVRAHADGVPPKAERLSEDVEAVVRHYYPALGRDPMSVRVYSGLSGGAADDLVWKALQGLGAMPTFGEMPAGMAQEAPDGQVDRFMAMARGDVPMTFKGVADLAMDMEIGYHSLRRGILLERRRLEDERNRARGDQSAEDGRPGCPGAEEAPAAPRPDHHPTAGATQDGNPEGTTAGEGGGHTSAPEPSADVTAGDDRHVPVPPGWTGADWETLRRY